MRCHVFHAIAIEVDLSSVADALDILLPVMGRAAVLVVVFGLDIASGAVARVSLNAAIGVIDASASFANALGSMLQRNLDHRRLSVVGQERTFASTGAHCFAFECAKTLRMERLA